jgi:hypothetical protein
MHETVTNIWIIGDESRIGAIKMRTLQFREETRQLSRYSDGLGSIPGRSNVFSFSKPFRPALGPTEPRIQHVPWRFSRGGNGREVKMTSI